MTTPNIERLKLTIKAVSESAKPEAFDMDCYMHGAHKGFSIDPDPHCGSPGCLLGHLAAREDLQNFLRLDDDFGLVFANQFVEFSTYDDALDEEVMRSEPKTATYDDPELCAWFGLNNAQAVALFGPGGCDNAKTVEEAAQYARAFIDAYEANARAREALANS